MRRSKKYSNVYVQPRKLIITKKKRKKKYSKKGNMVMKIYTKVNKLLNSQTTWYDSDLATTVSTTGHIQPIGLLDITKGTDSGQRLGDKIELKSISFKLQLDVINTSLANGDVFNQSISRFYVWNKKNIGFACNYIFYPFYLSCFL